MKLIGDAAIVQARDFASKLISNFLKKHKYFLGFLIKIQKRGRLNNIYIKNDMILIFLVKNVFKKFAKLNRELLYSIFLSRKKMQFN